MNDAPRRKTIRELLPGLVVVAFVGAVVLAAVGYFLAGQRSAAAIAVRAVFGAVLAVGPVLYANSRRTAR